MFGDTTSIRMDGSSVLSIQSLSSQKQSRSSPQPQPHSKPNQVGSVALYGIHIVSLVIEGQERLCLAQISNTLLKQFSYNEIHNRRVALGITCVQCTPVQLEILRRAGAMPPSSRRCGMITRREAERLCKSFLSDNSPPRLPEDFTFPVHHECSWGCQGLFLPSRYNSSRAKCIKCTWCSLFFSPNKFIFHSHRISENSKFVQPDAANFNSWRRHMKLSGNPSDETIHAWEDVKAMFNGGTRKRLISHQSSNDSMTSKRKTRSSSPSTTATTLVTTSAVVAVGSGASGAPVQSSTAITNNVLPTPASHPVHPRVPPFPDQLPLSLSRSLVMDYMWHQQQAAAAVAATKASPFPFSPYPLSWLSKRTPVIFSGPLPSSLNSPPSNEPLVSSVTTPPLHQSAFRPVIRSSIAEPGSRDDTLDKVDTDTDDEVDIETTEDDQVTPSQSSTTVITPINISPQCWSPPRESEKETERASADDGKSDVKQELISPKDVDSWHGSAFYRRLNILKAEERQGKTVGDCSACRPRTLFYQLNTSPASTN